MCVREDVSSRYALPAAGKVGRLLLLLYLFFFTKFEISQRHEPDGGFSEGGIPTANKCV